MNGNYQFTLSMASQYRKGNFVLPGLKLGDVGFVTQAKIFGDLPKNLPSAYGANVMLNIANGGKNDFIDYIKGGVVLISSAYQKQLNDYLLDIITIFNIDDQSCGKIDNNIRAFFNSCLKNIWDRVYNCSLEADIHYKLSNEYFTKWDDKPRLIIFDDFTKLFISKKQENGNYFEQIKNIAKILKRIACAENIGILCLCNNNNWSSNVASIDDMEQYLANDEIKQYVSFHAYLYLNENSGENMNSVICQYKNWSGFKPHNHYYEYINNVLKFAGQCAD